MAQTASNSGYNQTYNYTSNALGQSLSRTGSNAAYQWAPIAPGAVTLTANGLNQYTSVGGTSFSYDGRGNLTSDGSRSYGFDVYNRLTGVSGAGSMSLAYDPAGRLFETAANGATTRFLYDGTNLIAEYDTSGNLLRRYVQGAGSNEQLVWYEGSGTSDRRYLIQNELGTVVAADGPAGITTYSYDEYGNPNTWNGPSAGAPRFRYAGAIMLPEAQLYSMRARVYSPSIGHFLQTDPILFDGGMNLYAYTGNNPVNLVDPSGLKMMWVIIGCISVSEGGQSGGTSCTWGWRDDGSGSGPTPTPRPDPNSGNSGGSQPPALIQPPAPAGQKDNGKCSAAQKRLFQIGEAIELAGNIVKLGAIGAGGVGVLALGGGAVTGQLEVALPGALVLSRAGQAYEAGAAISTIGAVIQSVASGSSGKLTLDTANDAISRGLGLSGIPGGLLSDALGALEAAKQACGN